MEWTNYGQLSKRSQSNLPTTEGRDFSEHEKTNIKTFKINRKNVTSSNKTTHHEQRLNGLDSVLFTEAADDESIQQITNIEELGSGSRYMIKIDETMSTALKILNNGTSTTQEYPIRFDVENKVGYQKENAVYGPGGVVINLRQV